MLLKIYLVSLLLISTLILGCATPRARKNLEMEIQKSRAQAQAMEHKIKQSEAEIKDLEGQLEKERRLRRNLEKQIASKRLRPAEKQKETLPPISVRKIQRALRQAGFCSGSIDGKLGPRTRAAIRAFQEKKGLKVDGIVGNITWRELVRYLPEPQKTK